MACIGMDDMRLLEAEGAGRSSLRQSTMFNVYLMLVSVGCGNKGSDSSIMMKQVMYSVVKKVPHSFSLISSPAF